MSFFPSTIIEWNKLSPLMRIQDSLSKFKKYLNINFETEKGFFNYNLLSGPFTKILTQCRLGLCSLNNELFTYNLTDNPYCTHCCSEFESVGHFLLFCPRFQVARVSYFAKLRLFVTNFDSYHGKSLVNVCLQGSVDFDFDSNYNILLCTLKYIEQSKRFLDS